MFNHLASCLPSLRPAREEVCPGAARVVVGVLHDVCHVSRVPSLSSRVPHVPQQQPRVITTLPCQSVTGVPVAVARVGVEAGVRCVRVL